ncbi:netrin-3 isoform X2, partial [Lates japonicus]
MARRSLLCAALDRHDRPTPELESNRSPVTATLWVQQAGSCNQTTRASAPARQRHRRPVCNRCAKGYQQAAHLWPPASGLKERGIEPLEPIVIGFSEPVFWVSGRFTESFSAVQVNVLDMETVGDWAV